MASIGVTRRPYTQLKQITLLQRVSKGVLLTKIKTLNRIFQTKYYKRETVLLSFLINTESFIYLKHIYVRKNSCISPQIYFFTIILIMDVDIRIVPSDNLTSVPRSVIGQLVGSSSKHVVNQSTQTQLMRAGKHSQCRVLVANKGRSYPCPDCLVTLYRVSRVFVLYVTIAVHTYLVFRLDLIKLSVGTVPKILLTSEI